VRRLVLPLGLLAVLAAGTSLEAQVRLEGPGRQRGVQIVRDILADANYLLLARDTVLGPDFRAGGDVVVLEADVRMEGVVAGRIAVIGGDLFIRPGAVVPGPVVVLGGGVYPSGLAEVGPVIETPGVRPDILVDGDGYRVVLRGADTGPAIHPLGVFGLGLPSYDRVDGLTLRTGVRWRPLRTEAGPTLDGRVWYRSARRSPGGELRAGVPVGRGVRLTARAARETVTNEAWIRGDLANSLAALLAGSDVRDYWSADVLSVSLASVRLPAVQGETVLRPRVVLLRSVDAALETRSPWSLFRSLDRPNLGVDEGVMVSASAGADLTWQGRNSGIRIDLAVERGLPAGDFTFTQLVGDASGNAAALWGHRIEMAAHTRWAFDAAPRQRWSFVGGPGTLPTLPVTAMRGDRLVFLTTRYLAPLPFGLPLAGSPDLVIAHALGGAWQAEEARPPLEQNLGAGVSLLGLEAMLWVDPAAERLRPRLGVELRLPF
jgi:hypothetical protein